MGWGEWLAEWDRLCGRWWYAYRDGADSIALGSILAEQRRHLEVKPEPEG